MMRRVASQSSHCNQILTRTVGDGHGHGTSRVHNIYLQTQTSSMNKSCCALTASVSHNAQSNGNISSSNSLLFRIATCAASAVFSNTHHEHHYQIAQHQRRCIRIAGPATTTSTDKSSSGSKKDDIESSPNKQMDDKSKPTKTENTSTNSKENGNGAKSGSAIDASKTNTTILGSVGVGVGVVASIFFVRGAVHSVRMSRAFASSEAPMLPVFIIVVAGLAMGCFVYTVAVLTVNERRHVEQSQLRTRAKRRCVDIYNIDDFDKSVLLKSKGSEGQRQGTKDASSLLISETHPTLDPIVRLSGAIALDVGQFSSTASSAKSPQITQRGSSDATNTAVVATPIFDPAIGVPFDIVSSQPSSDALREGKTLLLAVEASQPLAKISSLVSSISSESFLTFIVEGLEGVRRRTFSNLQQAQDTNNVVGFASQFTSRVLALQRVVEVYQFKEKFDSSAKDHTSSYSYTPEWSSEPQRFNNPSSYRVVAKASTTSVGGNDSGGGDAYVSYVFKSSTDKTLQAFPFPQVHLKGSEISGTPTAKSSSVSSVASSGSVAVPRLPSGHIVAKVFGHGMLIPFPGSDKSSFLSSSYSCIAPLTLENSGTSFFFPVPGAVKLWLRPSPNPCSSDFASSATSSKVLPRLPFSGRRDTSGSNQPCLPLHTVVVDSNAFEEGRIVSWKPLSFKDLTKEGRALLERRLGVGCAADRGPATSTDDVVVRVNVEYTRPQENAMWLFRQASTMVNTGIDLNTKVETTEKESEGAALSSLILQANNGSPHETLASMITSAAAAGGSSESSSLLSSLFSSTPSSGPAAAAYKINKALLELQTKDNEERNKKSGASSTGEGELKITLVKNWSTPDPDPELLKVPSRRLRVSTCGTYLTTVQIDENSTGVERKPRIGDVRVRYEYLPASTVALVGTVLDDPQKGQWRGQGAVVASSSNVSAAPAAAANGVSGVGRVVHMPYVLRAWRFTDYLAEVRRTSGGEKDIEDQIKSRESLAYSAEMPSLATSVIDKTREKAAGKITNFYLSAAAKDENLTSDKEKWEETKQGFGDAVTDLFENIIPSTSVIPQWAMSAAEASLAKSLPLAVLCSSSREDATSTYLFRKHWWRDECGTWGQRYTGYLALQLSLALSTAILVPLPAVTLGYMCSAIAAGVWGQTVLMAKAELRQRARNDNSWRAAHEEKEIEFVESRKETKTG